MVSLNLSSAFLRSTSRMFLLMCFFFHLGVRIFVMVSRTERVSFHELSGLKIAGSRSLSDLK